MDEADLYSLFMGAPDAQMQARALAVLDMQAQRSKTSSQEAARAMGIDFALPADAESHQQIQYPQLFVRLDGDDGHARIDEHLEVVQILHQRLLRPYSGFS